jgi:hypothetical protein
VSKRKSISRKKRKTIRRELEGKRCYLCGEFGDILTDIPDEGRLTVDHVPPYGLSPNSPNSAFLFLPAHVSCNNKYSDQERKFIAYLAMACGYKGNFSADAAWAAAERSFKLNKIGRAGAPSKDLLRLVENTTPVEVRSRHGIIISSTRICWPSNDIDIQLVIGKIARGLHYYHTKTFVPETWKITIKLGQLLPEYVLEAPIHNRLGDFFAYEGGFDRSGSLWYMRIYNEAYALAQIDDPQQSIQLSESQPYSLRHISDIFPQLRKYY